MCVTADRDRPEWLATLCQIDVRDSVDTKRAHTHTTVVVVVAVILSRGHSLDRSNQTLIRSVRLSPLA